MYHWNREQIHLLKQRSLSFVQGVKRTKEDKLVTCSMPSVVLGLPSTSNKLQTWLKGSCQHLSPVTDAQVESRDKTERPKTIRSRRAPLRGRLLSHSCGQTSGFIAVETPQGPQPVHRPSSYSGHPGQSAVGS